MFNRIFILLTLLVFSCKIVDGNKTASVSKAESITVKLLDMYVINDKYIVPNHPDFLQKHSKALGYDIELNSKKFTIGFVDYDGDGDFSRINKDLVIISNFRNRQISINNRHGTHKVKVKGDMQYLKVDDIYFKVTLPDKDKFVTIHTLKKHEKPSGEILQLVTKVPLIDLADFDHNKVNLSKYFGQNKLVFIFFWNMKPAPQTTENDAQIKSLDKLAAHYAGKINLVGMRVPFSEPFGATNPVYLQEMRESAWDNLVCTEQFYEDMQQDLYFIKGVLANSSGEILDVNLAPRELLIQMESKTHE